MNGPPEDGYRRKIDYLRVSVTDRCNFRCIYCMPAEGVTPLPQDGILTYEEIVTVIRAAIDAGISRVRITGGEPLLRRDAVDLIATVRRLPGLADLSLTTNGFFLGKLAGDLARAGLSRVNVSLDSLRPDRFSTITRGGEVGRVVAGIQAAQEEGLGPIKVNMVPIRGFNDDELVAFARLTLRKPYHVRFIEYMPMNGSATAWNAEQMVPADEVVGVIEKAFGPLRPAGAKTGAGPARYYRIDGAEGKIGVITPVSNHFCGSCNRLRLTADGKLKPCLFSEDEIDLLPALRVGQGSLPEKIREAIDSKPERHRLSSSSRPMSRIGG